MIDAQSIQNITKRISSTLPRTVTITKREPIVEIGFMTTFNVNRPARYQTVKIQETRNSKLVGILFCHPKSSLAKSEIIEHLPHFHVRSGEAVDFFCIGYGAYWPPEHFADQKPVVTIQGVDWLFSESAFSSVVDEFESETSWKYSGETELILLTARKQHNGMTILDYDTAIVCNLEAMSQAKAFSSVRSFFEAIFKFAKSNNQEELTWELSDQNGVRLGKLAIKDSVISVLPKSLGDAYQRGEHFAVRSIAKHF
ncbi:hypothetical protein ACR2R6_01260 [Methylocaldum gracile subsp. desertum]|uniref:hypothetical protein n=1 Tax=Methylocaldum sp. GT1BW TaxID=3438964 RepID=UPI003DA11EF0